jgi:hypothetical protein
MENEDYLLEREKPRWNQKLWTFIKKAFFGKSLKSELNNKPNQSPDF